MSGTPNGPKSLNGPKALNGHCLCGAVRYRVPYPFDDKVAHCHCAMCRRAAGSIAVTWFTIPRKDFELLGLPTVGGGDRSPSLKAGRQQRDERVHRVLLKFEEASSHRC